MARKVAFSCRFSAFKAGATAAITLLAACGGISPSDLENLPQPRPETHQPKPNQRPTQEELQQARAERNRAKNESAVAGNTVGSARNRYARIQQELLAQGRLRSDRVAADAPYDVESLVRDFVQVALRDEYGPSGQKASGGSAPLRRWQQPVRMQVVFGDSIDAGDRNRVRSQIAGYAARIERATGGHPVSLTADRGNFIILFLNDNERHNVAGQLGRIAPDIPAQDIIALRDLSPQIYCTVFAYSKGRSASYAKAVALIRAELPPLLQLSCIHEELAQGMGLANDSPASRPSIFNDDEEFALLTQHDELLLKILYDPRLQPGMTEAEATPIVRKIAQELVPGNS